MRQTRDTAAESASSRKPKTRSVKAFPVVGIGASAGGLEAFMELLRALPRDTGMAYVLVQHLDPNHKSGLVDILAKKTELPLREVANNIRVEPNHVYVVPPNVEMTISGGALKLKRRHREPGLQRSIDGFFQSLARDRGAAAIGVVLSGSANDGTLGLEDIKDAGGITFAQDEKSARFSSMPRSAIAAGCVDFILPPARIAQELGKIAVHPQLAPLSNGEEDAPLGKEKGNLDKVLRLLHARLGVDLTLYKPMTIQRRVARRMVLNKVPRLSAYVTFLRDHPEELEALYQDIPINVTRFFRDSPTFDLIKQKIFPRLVKNRSVDDPVRVWVVGCSSGQESYSIAIAFLEFAGKSSVQIPLQIFATDLNETVLEKARIGHYSKNQLQDMSPQRLRRFFTEEDGGFRICKPVREMCVFARHDVLSDPPFSRMDLLSCRNMMIYFEQVLQKKLIPLFHYALKPKGFLLLGSSETIGSNAGLFESVGKQIFAKKVMHAPERARPAAPTLPKQPPPKPPGLASGASAEMDVLKEADRLTLAKYAPAGVLVNAAMEVIQFRGQTSPFLEPPPGRASFNLLKMLREGLLLPVRSGIEKARKRNVPVRSDPIEFRVDGHSRRIRIEVVPLRQSKECCFLVSFEDIARRAGPLERNLEAEPAVKVTPRAEVLSRENERLRQEIAAARDYLQSVTEQHDAVYEELQAASEESESSNEELQSINEELETTKEELESTNEELTTVNEEMGNRNLELHQTNSDLNNVLNGVQMCIVVLGSDLCIRRFTPLAEKIFNLVPTDVGRPINNLRTSLQVPDLEQRTAEVIRSMRSSEEEVQDDQERWYSLRILPYKTIDNRIDGAVVVLVDIDAVKRSEEQIKSARDYAESTFESVREPLVTLDERLRIEKANRSFYKAFRLAPAEAEGRALHEVLGQQWQSPKLRKPLEEILPRKTQIDDLEVEGDFERIGRRVFLVSARPVLGPGAKPQSILLALEDFTDRKQLEILRESETRFRTLAETLPQLVWTCPPDGKCDYFNARWTEYTGLPQEKLLGDQWRETMSPLDREETCDYWLKALQGNVPYDLEFRLRRADGVYRWFKTRASPVLDANGRIQKWFGTCTDIDDQKQANEVLEQSERWLRLIMESVRDFAISTVDREGRIIDWNPGAERLFGYHPDEILGESAALLFTPEDRANGIPEKELATAEAEGCAMDERWHLRKNGERFFVSGVMRAVRDENGTLRGFTKVARDITDRKRQEQELQKAHDELEQRVNERTARLGETVHELEAFSYSVSHDLRAPLRAMLGFAALALARGGESLDPTVKDSIERIERAAHRLDRLILDVLSYSKVSRAEMQLARIDLDRLVRDVVNQYPGFQSPEITIEIEGRLLPVLGHEAALTQCVANLLTNAIKFVPPGANPYVRIRSESLGNQVKLSIIDNGIGIEPEDLPRIFGIFERLHPSQSYDGTGIGLAIVRKAAERMGGHVGVESAPGRGSVFWILLQAPPDR